MGLGLLVSFWVAILFYFLTKPRPLGQHDMIVGKRGAGKGYVTQVLIHEELMRGLWRWRDPRRRAAALREARRGSTSVDSPDNLVSTVPLHGHLVKSMDIPRESEGDDGYRKPAPQRVREPSLVYIDEMQEIYNARRFKDFKDGDIHWWTHQRKYDVRTISNTQHPDFVDRICRILTDRVVHVKMHSWPFVGWLTLGRAVRPAQYVRMEEGHLVDGDRERGGAREGDFVRSDAKGDTFWWWQRAFGFGTFFTLTYLPPAILGGIDDLEEAERESLRKKRLYLLPRVVFFNLRFADRYSSTAGRKA